MVGVGCAAFDSAMINLDLSLPSIGRAYAIEAGQTSIRGEHHDQTHLARLDHPR